jgi:hypothetical protein
MAAAGPYGFPFARMILPGFYLRGEGQISRNGLNIYPPSEWRHSRGFILKLGSRSFRCRYSVSQRRWLVGWNARVKGA